MMVKQGKIIPLCLIINITIYLFWAAGVAQAGGASGHNAMPASALDLVEYPAVLDPTTNIVHVGACPEVIVQPSMKVPASDIGRTAQLLMYIYLPDLGFGFDILSKPITLKDETLCDLLPSPIDLSTSAGLRAYVYFGYSIGSSIKYSAYTVIVDPYCTGQKCKSDQDCPSGQYCKYPVITDGGLDYSSCTPDVCPPPGTCEKIPEGLCIRQADCSPGQECEFILPCLMCIGCPCFGKCVSSNSSECLSDADCPLGQHCKIEEVCPPCVDSDPPCMMPCMAQGKCYQTSQ